jgi:hypothetical protein
LLGEYTRDESFCCFDTAGPRECIDRLKQRLAVKDCAGVLEFLCRPRGIAGDHWHLIDENELGEAVAAILFPITAYHRAAHGVACHGDAGKVFRDEEFVDVSDKC